MKNKLLIKFVKFFTFALVISFAALAAHSYSFIKYGAKLFDGDFRTIYGVVCKNTNILYQQVDIIDVEDDNFFIKLSDNIFRFKSGNVSANYKSAFDIFSALSEQYPDKLISVTTEPLSWNNGGSFLIRSSEENANCIKAVYFGCIDGIEETLPINRAITVLYTNLTYTDNAPALLSFPEVKVLDLAFWKNESENGSTSELKFLNDLSELEDLTIKGDPERLDFSEVNGDNIKNFTFDSMGECSPEYEKMVRDIFPNAEIKINTL